MQQQQQQQQQQQEEQQQLQEEERGAASFDAGLDDESPQAGHLHSIKQVTTKEYAREHTSYLVTAGESWRGYFYLCLAMLIFSSSSTAFSFFNELDKELFTPLTVLCTSNATGLCFILAFFRRDLTRETVQALSRVDWAWLFAGSFLYSGIAPFLFTTALDTVSVADSAILQRLESLNIIVLCFVFHGTRISYWSFANASLTLTGIALTLAGPAFFGASDRVSFSTGNLYVLSSGWCYSLSLLISMNSLTTIPVSLVAIYRVFVGTILQFILVLLMGDANELKLFGSLRLWAYMLPYGFIYVFCAQIFWLLALTQCTPLTVSVGTTLQFILTILWAISVLGQLPTDPQWIGFAVITASIASSVCEKLHGASSKASADTDAAFSYSPLSPDGKDFLSQLAADVRASRDSADSSLGHLPSRQSSRWPSRQLSSRQPSRNASVSALQSVTYERVDSISLDAHRVGL